MLRGERVIIYFYPAASTPGCTKQACDFSDSLSSLSAAGSPCSAFPRTRPPSWPRFAERDGLTFPLLSDPERKVLQAYGAYGEKMLYGKKVVGVIRSTFVVGADGGGEAQYASRRPATLRAARRLAV